MFERIANAFSFRGRLSRGEYLYARRTNVAVAVVLSFGVFIAGSVSGDWALAGPVLAMILVIYGWAALAAGVRRLHDHNRSGLWLILYWFLPPAFALGGFWISTVLPVEVAALAWQISGLIALALALLGVGQLYVLSGDAAANRFGPPPA